MSSSTVSSTMSATGASTASATLTGAIAPPDLRLCGPPADRTQNPRGWTALRDGRRGHKQAAGPTTSGGERDAAIGSRSIPGKRRSPTYLLRRLLRRTPWTRPGKPIRAVLAPISKPNSTIDDPGDPKLGHRRGPPARVSLRWRPPSGAAHQAFGDQRCLDLPEVDAPPGCE